MKKKSLENQAAKQTAGTLFVCATPLGNLEDISLRVIKSLKSVDIIAAEDTRVTQNLLQHFQIKKTLVSYFDFNKKLSAEKIIKELLTGKNIALVTDAGTPGIADPGYLLIKQAIARSIKITPLPGASAVITALCISGLPTDKFIFEGFLPRKEKALEKT